jgi:hypothetical protein
MIRVQGPDGFSIEFPADTSQDVIRNVMSQRYGAPEAKQDPAMALPSDTSLAADPIRAQVDRERAETLFNNPALFERQKMGYARRILQGPTMGLADEVIAGFSAPFEMIKRGTFNPIRGYEFAKAQEDAAYDEARERQGILGTAAEIGGGIVGGTAIAKGLQAAPAAVTKAGQIAQSILGGLRGSGNIGTRLGTAAGGGALYGGLSGIGEGRGVEDRLAQGATGALVGGALGGALQGVAEVAKPTLGWVSASMDPKGFAQRQLARGISESRRDARDIIRDVADARAAGQPFTVADAMGKAGQKQLSVVVRNPGEGSTRATDFLDARQGAQGRRLQSFLAEGLDASQTAQQARAAQTEARNAAADVNYAAARGSAGTVDPSKAIAAADDFLQPGAMRLMSPQSGIADDSVSSLVGRARSYLTDGNSVLSDFNSALRVKVDLDGMIDNARPAAQSKLIPIRNALDDALAAASKPYANARNTFREQSKAIKALDTGRTLATRGRSEDTIPTFQGMTAPEQASARIGYADPLIEKIQGARIGTNKAADFTAMGVDDELRAFAAPGRADLLMSRIGRENTMFDTRARAMGGSQTSDNFSDNAAMAVNPEIVSNLLSGNWVSAARNIVSRSGDFLGGNTEKVRDELSRYLLMTGNAQNLPADLAKAIATKAKRDEIANRILRGAYAGTGSATSQAQGQARTK